MGRRDTQSGQQRYTCACIKDHPDGRACQCTTEVWSIPGIDTDSIRCPDCANSRHQWG